MVTIKSRCHVCGDVDLTPDQFVVSGPTYWWNHCGHEYETTNARAAEILASSGAIRIDLTTIDEEWKQWSI